MCRINPKLIFFMILSFSLLWVLYCNKVKCYNEEELLSSLSKQRGSDFLPFIDSIYLMDNPKQYNPSYECLALGKLKKTAPSVLNRNYFFFKLKSVDSIGYVAFDELLKITGIPNNVAFVVMNSNRERSHFSILTFTKSGVTIGFPFLRAENSLGLSNCLELSYNSIHCRGKTINDRQIKLRLSCRYDSNCQGVDEKNIEKKITLSIIR